LCVGRPKKSSSAKIDLQLIKNEQHTQHTG